MGERAPAVPDHSKEPERGLPGEADLVVDRHGGIAAVLPREAGKRSWGVALEGLKPGRACEYHFRPEQACQHEHGQEGAEDTEWTHDLSFRAERECSRSSLQLVSASRSIKAGQRCRKRFW